MTAKAAAAGEAVAETEAATTEVTMTEAVTTEMVMTEAGDKVAQTAAVEAEVAKDG